MRGFHLHGPLPWQTHASCRSGPLPAPTSCALKTSLRSIRPNDRLALDWDSLDVELDRVSGIPTDTSLLQWSAADVRLEPCLVFLAEELLVAASTLGLNRDHERQEKGPEMTRRKQTLRTLLDALNELQDEELEAPAVGGV